MRVAQYRQELKGPRCLGINLKRDSKISELRHLKHSEFRFLRSRVSFTDVPKILPEKSIGKPPREKIAQRCAIRRWCMRDSRLHKKLASPWLRRGSVETGKDPRKWRWSARCEPRLRLINAGASSPALLRLLSGRCWRNQVEEFTVSRYYMQYT